MYQTVDILERISDAFYALDREWRFTYINRRAEQLWQRTREELLGKRIWDAFPQAIGSPSYQAHLRATEAKDIQTVVSREGNHLLVVRVLLTAAAAP